MDESRSFRNTYDDFDPACTTVGKANIDVEGSIVKCTKDLIQKLDNLVQKRSSDSYSVYTGSAGVAFLYNFFGRRVNPTYFNKAIEIIERIIPTLKGQRISFLNGDAGPLALGAVIHDHVGNEKYSRELVSRLTALLPRVLDTGSNIADEILYGRAGYLYALLYVNTNIGHNTIPVETVRKVVAAILQSGQRCSQAESHVSPLMYIWHDKHYLGAAHGLSGILYMLLKAKEYLTPTEMNTLVRPSIDFLRNLQFEYGNFPSSLESYKNRLVQWCHGAPGMVELFCLAYEVYGDEKYLRAAGGCGEHTWMFGLLKKGYSLCHGVAGNGYAFLRLYQMTNEPIHLYRAQMFASWCTTYDRQQLHVPDHPLSLFEGLAGLIHFMIDVSEPQAACFPAYGL